MAKFLTLGSCFAREIRKFLFQAGFKVYPLDTADNLVHYNTYTLRYEFEGIDNAENYFYQNSDRQWQNPFRRCLFAPTKDELLRVTKQYDSFMKEWIAESYIVIITLGMSECFKIKDRICNSHPQYNIKGRSGIRAEFYNATIEDNISNLKRIRELLPDKRLIFTVSPVPLSRTFTDLKLSKANKASKEKLREAVKFVDAEYFDSYEFALSLDDIYKKDGRHVKDEIVKQIVNRFFNYMNYENSIS